MQYVFFLTPTPVPGLCPLARPLEAPSGWASPGLRQMDALSHQGAEHWGWMLREKQVWDEALRGTFGEGGGWVGSEVALGLCGLGLQWAGAPSSTQSEAQLTQLHRDGAQLPCL